MIAKFAEQAGMTVNDVLRIRRVFFWPFLHPHPTPYRLPPTSYLGPNTYHLPPSAFLLLRPNLLTKRPTFPDRPGVFPTSLQYALRWCPASPPGPARIPLSPRCQPPSELLSGNCAVAVPSDRVNRVMSLRVIGDGALSYTCHDGTRGTFRINR